MAIDSLTKEVVASKLTDIGDETDNSVREGLRNLANQVDATEILLANVDDNDKLSEFASITATADDINLTTDITTEGSVLDALTGSFTTDDLNKLDGVTATTDELNIVSDSSVTETNLDNLDGVDSSIQDQIDATGGGEPYDSYVVDTAGDHSIDLNAAISVVNVIIDDGDQNLTIEFEEDDTRIGQLIFVVINTVDNEVQTDHTLSIIFPNRNGSELTRTTQGAIVYRYLRVELGYQDNTLNNSIFW